MWGLDDLLDDVIKADGQFRDVGDDIRQAFSAGVTELDKHITYINDNVMYFAAAVLDLWIKCNLIKEQYPDTTGEIIERIRVYLKKEFATLVLSTITRAELVVLSNTSVY
jgi:hypothetical protein